MVRNILAVKSALVFEILIELLVDIVLDHIEAVLAIEAIAEARSVDNGYPQFNTLLNNIQLFLVYGHCPLQDFVY